MQRTNKTTGGTSFHDTVIGTTIHTLNTLLGEPTYVNNTGMDKVNYEWEMETSDGDVFTVYSWKEYKILHEHEIIEFHIGGESKTVTEQAKNEMYEAMANLK